MNRKREWSAVAATLAAAAGAGFSSGREIVFFFAQMGWASWIGVGFASAMYGALCGIICHFAKMTGGETLPGVYLRVLGARQGTVVCALYGLLMAVAAGVMIVTTGELAALALPLRNAFWMGALFSTGLALLLSMHGMRRMAALGAVTVILCAVFHIALALDPREVSIYHRYETVPELSGSVTAALLLSTLHAALSASLSGGAVAGFSGRTESPVRFTVRCGVGMLVLLVCANAAIMRGGERLLSQALPTVVLAARWGTFGYYASILTMWLCSLTTLCAALGAIAGQMNDGRSARRAMVAVLLLGVLAAMLLGIERFVELGYPMLGWAGAFSLAGLVCCFEIGSRSKPAGRRKL